MEILSCNLKIIEKKLQAKGKNDYLFSGGRWTVTTACWDFSTNDGLGRARTENWFRNRKWKEENCEG